MEMRLGKTLVAIRFIKEKNFFPCLILCPNNVKRTWGNELRDDGEDDFIILEGDKEDRNDHLKLGCKFVILNYESLITLKRKAKAGVPAKKFAGVNIDSVEWASVIIDESQRVSNASSSITKLLLKKFSGTIGPARLPLPPRPKMYLLSGLPAPENEMQYCTQFILGHGHFLYFRNFWSFRSQAFNKVGFEWAPKPGIKTEIYDFIHDNAFIKSRSDAGLVNLKTYTRRYVKMTDAQKKAYKSMLKHFEYNGIEANNDLSQLTFLQQLAGGVDISHPEKTAWLSVAKFDLIRELLEGELKGDSVLIWCRYTAEVVQCEEYLRGYGFNIRTVTGETDSVETESVRLDFNAKKTQLVAATIRKLSTGTSWKGADTAIYLSNEFSNDLRSQSEDRIYDVEKNYPLLIIDVCTEKTMDESTVDALTTKKIDAKFFLSHLFGEMRRLANA